VFGPADLGIKPRGGRRPRATDGRRWAAEQLALLGTLPDSKVAVKIGRTLRAVQQKRERLGIPNPNPGRWTAEEVVLLGTAPDDQVARRLGLTEPAVRQKRQKLGIPPCGLRRPP
jgi:hypothetical protein